ncbi:MAG: PAS domain S-box protein [Bacteroidetes bacterium]|nr:PAS domain S-box protein [Bacteroidota bacterium]
MAKKVQLTKKSNSLSHEEQDWSYRALAESINDLFFALDKDFRYTYWNKAGEKLTGISAAEVIGKSMFEFFPEIKGSKVEKVYRSVLNSGKPQTLIRDFPLGSGKQIFETYIYPSKSGLSVFGKDITTRRKQELLQNTLYKISAVANSGVSLQQLFRSIHKYIGEIIYAKNFYIALYNAAEDLISFPYFVDEKDSFSGPYKARKGLTEYVIRTGKPLLVDGFQHQELIKSKKVDLIGQPAKIWLGVPLVSKKNIIGVLTVQNYTDQDAYSIKDQDMLMFVSSHITAAIGRKQSEEKILISQKMLMESQKIAKLGSFNWDIKADEVTGSEELYRIWGLDLKKIQNNYTDFVRMIHPDDKPTVEGTLREAIDKKKPYSLEFRIILSNNQVKIIQTEAKIKLNSHGKATHIIGTCQDVTESKKVERKLQEKEELLKATIESTGDGILVVDKKGKVTHTNELFAQMWNMPRTILTQKNDQKFLNFVMDQLKDPKSFLKKVKKLYRNIDEDLDLLYFKDGRVFERFSKPLIYSNKLEGRVWSFRDITKRTKAEQELKNINQELELFMYKTSHNFKGPAASIRGLIDVALQETKDPNAHNYLELIEKSTVGLEKTLDSLLEVIRVKQGKINLKKIDFNKILEEVVDSLKYLPGFSEVKFKSVIPNKSNFYSDRTLLVSIFQNLIENAVKYRDLKKKSLVKISVEEDEKTGVKIQVEDNGLGIRSDVEGEIFNMFFRANEFSKGIGLGLYLVKNSVEKLNGSIRVRSKEGKGTNFSLYLPNLK